jgi:uncharacterized membrane protein HdeD (DUF308 family)
MHHHIMSKFWWILAVRGVLGIVLGISAVVWILTLDQVFPQVFGFFLFLKAAEIVATLILLMGLYAFIDGLFAILLGAQDYGGGKRWWMLLAEGVVSVSLGSIAWFWTDGAVLVLLYWIGAWAVVTGFLEITQAFDLNEYKDRRRPFLFAGSCSILFGIIILALPVAGIDLVWLMGGFAFASGIPILALALKLRPFAKHPR